MLVNCLSQRYMIGTKGKLLVDDLFCFLCTLYLICGIFEQGLGELWISKCSEDQRRKSIKMRVSKESYEWGQKLKTYTLCGLQMTEGQEPGRHRLLVSAFSTTSVIRVYYLKFAFQDFTSSFFCFVLSRIARKITQKMEK